MPFIITAKRGGDTGEVIETGVITSAGIASVALVLNIVHQIQLSEIDGTSTAILSLILKQALSIVAAGTSSASLALSGVVQISLSTGGVATVSDIELEGDTGIFSMRAHGTSNAETDTQLAINSASFNSDGTSEADSFMRVNDEANVFINAVTGGIAVASINLGTEVISLLKSEGQGNANINFSLDKAPSAVLLITLDIYPSESFNRYQEYRARFKVDEEEIPITRAEYGESSNGMDKRFSATLARISDRVKIKPTSNFTFEIGTLVDSTVEWDLLIDSTLVSNTYNIGWANRVSQDKFTLTTRSEFTEKLNKTPLGGLVIYDSALMAINASEYPIIYDTSGRGFIAATFPIADMTLYDLFSYIFVNRCGFSGYQTNIGNYRVAKVEVNINENYIQSVGGVIGTFEPLIFELSGEAWIYDTTQKLPLGFPLPKTLISKDYKSFQKQTNYRVIDGYRMNFVQTITNGGIILTIDNLLDSVVGNVTTRKTVRNWRSAFNSAQVIKTEEFIETTETRDDSETLIGTETIHWNYDNLQRPTGYTKDVYARVPDLGSSEDDLTYILEQVIDENFQITYGPHPYIQGKIIKIRTEKVTNGLISIDSDNKYLGQDYKESFIESHKAGNLQLGMDTEYGPITTEVEETIPLPNGQVMVKQYTIDHVQGVVLPNGISEPREGDVSVNSIPSQAGKMYVFESDDVYFLEGKFEDISVGEIPLGLAIPLVRRKLLKVNNGEGKSNHEIIGYDRAMRRGKDFTIVNRDGDTISVILVEGFTLTMENLGDRKQQTVMTSIQGIDIQ